MSPANKEKLAYLLLCGWTKRPRKPHQPTYYNPPYDTIKCLWTLEDAWEIQRMHDGRPKEPKIQW